MKRREFLGAVAASAALPLVAGAADEPERNGIPYRKLGRTGESVSLLGVGGHHIGRPKDENDGIAIIRAAIDAGVNFLDNSWDYHEGVSELRMGKALADGYRHKVFLMTKIDGRTKKEATKQIDQSLLRLRVDCIDLVQHHEVIRLEDPDRIFAEGGAQEAFLAARKAGKLRFIGFTGHKDPYVHLRMLKVAKEHGFRFDTAQMPINVMDAHFRSFQKDVVPVLVSEGIGVIGMKSMGDGLILKSKTATPAECLRYAMSQPVSVQVSGMETMQMLKDNLALAKSFQPMTEKEQADLLARTAKAATGGEYEKFKTTSQFDSTATHPQWLGIAG